MYVSVCVYALCFFYECSARAYASLSVPHVRHVSQDIFDLYDLNVDGKMDWDEMNVMVGALGMPTGSRRFWPRALNIEGACSGHANVCD